MSGEAETLGGRLPLLDPGMLSADQRAIYDRLGRTMIPWADAAGFQSQTQGGRVIGPFNPLLFSPGITQAFLDLQEAEQKHTSLSKRVREVVILAVGGAWGSEYEVYAHEVLGRKAGLSETAVRALAAGGLPGDLGDDETLAQRYARQLSTRHRVDDALYAAAEQAFGRQGLVEITYLVGIYHMVCAMLNGFEIPAPVAQREAAAETAPVSSKTRQAKLTTVACFPAGYFLENLAVRADNSVLVTAMNHGELWFVPAAGATLPVEPVRIHSFAQPTTGIVEVEPDVFYVSTSNAYTSHESYLHRLDLRGWSPGEAVRPQMALRFPEAARGLNGSCLIAPGTLLVADCFAGLIWRVEVPAGGTASARVWLRHDSMGYFPGKMKPEQPGVNGVRYAPEAGYLYYTATAKKLFMRVRVDPRTLDPAGEPEIVVAGRMGDDFCIDEDAGVMYLATHRQNTIDRVSMDPGDNSGFTESVAGDPFTDELIGPSSGAWGRGPGEHGRVAYFITDGGTASPPPDGVARPAKLLRVEL